MSATRMDAKKMCEHCSEYVKIYITCFKCNAAYHIYCWKNVPGAYVNERGQLFCCGSLTSNYVITGIDLGVQDSPPKRVIEKENADSYKEDFENPPIKREDSEWNEFKCDACHLEFMNKEYLENHCSECPNKEEGFVQEFVKEDKDLENYLHKEEDLEWSEFRCGACLLEFMNKEHLINHYSECPNKEGEFIEVLKEHTDLEIHLPKEENSEPNEKRLENHCSQSPNKQGEPIPSLNKDKNLENHLPKEENFEPNKRHLEDHCIQSPNKQGTFVPGLSNDKDGLFYSLCNDEDFHKESYEQHIKQCHVESGHSQANKDNSIWITNTKRNPAQADDKGKSISVQFATVPLM